jgi:hypothetical protein
MKLALYAFTYSQIWSYTVKHHGRSVALDFWAPSGARRAARLLWRCLMPDHRGTSEFPDDKPQKTQETD